MQPRSSRIRESERAARGGGELSDSWRSWANAPGAVSVLVTVTICPNWPLVGSACLPTFPCRGIRSPWAAKNHPVPSATGIDAIKVGPRNGWLLGRLRKPTPRYAMVPVGQSDDSARVCPR